MPPTNHAARLREMADEREYWPEEFASPTVDAAALLAGAEALEAIGRADKCLDGISVTAAQCFDRAAEVADLAERVLDAMEGRRINQMGKTLGQIAYEAWLRVLEAHFGGEYQTWKTMVHWQRHAMEAASAAVAAEVRREMGWRPIAEAPEGGGLFVGMWDKLDEWHCAWPRLKQGAIHAGYTHYLPQPEPPPQEPKA